jgi:hypothetical protein
MLASHQLVAGFVAVHKWPELSASDWGTWAGSVGTVATLIWTVRLATAQTRQKAQDDFTLANLHAASMVLRLIHAEAMVSSSCEIFSAALQTPIALTVEHLNDMDFRLSSIEIWDTAELVPLVPLPNNIAMKLAQVADQLQTARKLLPRTVIHYPDLTHEERLGFVEHTYAMLSTTYALLHEAVDVCNERTGGLHSRWD